MRLHALGLLALVAVTGCNNFDGLVERCVAEGRCGETSGAGGGAGGGQASVNATLRLLPPALSFGQVVEREDAELQLTVTNDGPDAVQKIDATVVGSSRFSAVSGCQTLLAKDGSCAVTVTFAPVAAGQVAATLQLQPAGLSPIDVALTGEGKSGLEIAPVSQGFPDTNSGSTSVLSFTITNRTSSLLSPTYVFNPAGVFTRSGCDQVSGNDFCQFNVQFAPPDAGHFQSSLIASAASGANNWSTPAVALDGLGIRRGALGISPDPISGATDAGTSRDFTFTLSNNSPTTIGPITVGLDPPGGPYSIISGGCSSLDAGATCAGVVRFQPPSIGDFSATLVADAGLGGIALSQLTNGGSGTFPVRLTVTPLDAGVILRPDAGWRCAGDCTFDVFVVPPLYPQLSFGAQGTATHFGLETWTGDCADAGFDDTCVKAVNGPLTIGATFKRANYAFVTPVATTGNFGGRSGADAYCQATAQDGGLPGIYVAWLSGPGPARDRLPDAGGWTRTDGLPFAKDKAGLLAGQLFYPLALNHRGAAVGNVIVWTGTQPDGSGNPSNYDCSDWTQGAPSLGTQGVATDGTAGWTSMIGNFNCGTTAHLYCFGVDSRAPATPPACDGAGTFLFTSEPRAPAVVTGAAALDGYCLAEAMDAGYSGNYVAWINSGGAAVQRLNPTLTGPVYRPDCALLTTDYAALRTSRVDLRSAPNVDAKRRYVTDDVALGSVNPTLDDGNAGNCQDFTIWNSFTSPPYMTSGRPTGTSQNKYWGYNGGNCGYVNTKAIRTYCIRGP